MKDTMKAIQKTDNEVTLAELVDIIGGDIAGDANKPICGIAPIDTAGKNDITFADSAKALKQLEGIHAGAVIVPCSFTSSVSVNLVYSSSPRLTFARALRYFYPKSPPDAGISRKASIGADLRAGRDVSIGPSVVIGDNVVLGDRVCLYPGVVVGDNVKIGDDSEVYPNVTILADCYVGSRVIIHSGTVIGSDGYGFVPDGDTHFKIPQVGIVQIEDDVEIGACNTIDRATFGRTWIRQGVKTDNQVHIGHNVTIGENSLIVAQVGIAGSTSIGRNVTLAGQAGISGHINIGDAATVGPQAGVSRSVAQGEVVSGTPEMPHRQWLKVNRIIARLPEIKKRVDKLEAMVKKMTGNGEAKNG